MQQTVKMGENFACKSEWSYMLLKETQKLLAEKKYYLQTNVHMCVRTCTHTHSTDWTLKIYFSGRENATVN